LVKDSRLCAVPRTVTVRASHATSDSKQMSAGMITALAAELEGRVALELIAEIVRSVLDETRQSARDDAAEYAILEARLRLERFIRARSPG
jgi:hypothetical protein